MASPKQAIHRYDLSLSFSEFNAELNRRRFIGHQVFPLLSVAEQSADFLRLKIASFLTPVEDTTRAPRGTYNRDDFEWDTDSYATAEHGVEEVVDDRQIKIYGSEINAEAINRERGINRVAQDYENTCAKLAFDTAYFTGNYTAHVVNDKTLRKYSGYAWTDKANADPVLDIDVAREEFITNCGTEPNALVLEKQLLIKLIRSARIEDLVKYTGRLDDKTVTQLMPQLRELFQLDRIIVAGSAVKNTAGKGVEPVFGRMWDATKALLCRIYDGPDLEAPEPHLGRTISWSEEAPLPGADGEGIGILVEEYREEKVRGGIIRARTDYAIKRLHKPAGLLLTGLAA